MGEVAKIVEEKPEPGTRSEAESLAYRLRQQSLLSEFGHRALEVSDLDQLFCAAVGLTGKGMRSVFCKLLEYLPDEHRLLVRAGIGWRPGVVGHETLGVDLESPAGFAFQTGEAVISNHLENEQRFRTPRLLAEHGVKRATNVLVPVTKGRAWGVLAADSPDEGQFDAADIEFMRGMAQILGAAIQRLDNENALRASEEQFRTMADSLPQLAWMADPKGWIYWYNQRWYEYTGTTLAEMEGWGWRKVQHPEHVERVVKKIQHAWDSGEPWEDTFPLRGADGEYRWFLSRAIPIHDADGRIKCWFGTNTDITEQRRQGEFQELLIREISHRVKNSLTLVSALLSLQSKSVPEASKAALADAASRVHAVATVHDQLFRQTNAREIDLKPFLSNLASAIAAGAPEHETIADVEDASVSADLAVPVGLLVNELVTNAYKYAYPEGEPGAVRIGGELVGKCQYRIEVSDYGRGLPEGFDLKNQGSSLGMRVITTLAKQLGGELTCRSTHPGACFSLRFPLREARSVDRQ